MTLDLTGIAASCLAAVISIVGSLFLAWLQSHMKDQQAAVTVGRAVQNALGVVQNAVDTRLTAHPLLANLPSGTSPAVAAGVQYVLSQAGAEVDRINSDPTKIAGKIEAQLGLDKRDTNAAVATAAAAAPTVVRAP
jgi:hypothetical protein